MLGKYAIYIWSAYGIAGFVLILNVLDMRRQAKRIRQQLSQQFVRDFK